MPVSYDSSQLLKCTVSFTYDRYTASNTSVSSTYTRTEEPTQSTATGVPNLAVDNLFTNTQLQFGVGGVPELPGLVGTGALA